MITFNNGMALTFVVIVIVFLYRPPWKWPHKLQKPVGGLPVKKKPHTTTIMRL